MQKLILTTALLFCSVTLSFCQNFAGKRIVTGNVYLSYNSNSQTTNFGTGQTNLNNTLSLSTSFLSGKIKPNNTYIAYGFNAYISNTKLQTGDYSRSYSLGPIIQFGKFVKIFDQFYFAPRTNISANISWGSFDYPTNNYTGTTSGFGVGATLSPLSFVYQLNEKLLFNISMGNLGFSYSSSSSSSNVYSSTNNILRLSGGISNEVGIGAFYLF